MLYKHQQDIINDDLKKCGLFLGTGSGKTIIALSLAQGTILIVAPKTQVLDGNWERANIDIKKNITVISKEIFRRDWQELPKYDTVILDEAHTMTGVTTAVKWVKGKSFPKASQIFDALKSYLILNNPDRLYLLTATPTRSAMCVYGIAKLLDKDINYYQFREEYYFKLNIPGRDIYTAKSDEATKNKLAALVKSLGYVGRLSDYFDVPEQTYKDVFIDITTEQKKKLKELPLEYPEPIVLLGKKLQVENGILNGDEYNPSQIFNNSKIEAILEYSEEFPRIVVFSRYLLQIEELKKTLEKAGKKVFIMTGDTTDRGKIIKDVNECDDYVFIVSAQISAGWELPKCEVMIFISRTYSLVDYIQSQGRILRANALKKNLYINLITKGGTIDNAVHESLINKVDFNEKIYVEKRS